MTRTLKGLALGCHPGPTIVVTAIAAALAVGVGRNLTGTVLVVATVLSGQLSIGWSNDWLDAARDIDTGRADKPVVAVGLAAETLRNAALFAAITTIPLSFLNGLAAGWAHLVLVASGWAYNVGLKRMWLSWLPYALGFGFLPAFITLGLPAGVWPPWWAMSSGALLGVGAHFANVLPDIDEDRSHGVNGLPQRLGATVSAYAAVCLLVGASALLLVAPAVPPTIWEWLGLLVVAGLAVWAMSSVVTKQPLSAVFRAAMLIALVDAFLFVGSASLIG